MVDGRAINGPEKKENNLELILNCFSTARKSLCSCLWWKFWCVFCCSVRIYLLAESDHIIIKRVAIVPKTISKEILLLCCAATTTTICSYYHRVRCAYHFTRIFIYCPGTVSCCCCSFEKERTCLRWPWTNWFKLSKHNSNLSNFISFLY